MLILKVAADEIAKRTGLKVTYNFLYKLTVDGNTYIAKISFQSHTQRRVYVYVGKDGTWYLCNFKVHLSNPKFLSIMSDTIVRCLKTRQEKGEGSCIYFCKDRAIWLKQKI